MNKILNTKITTKILLIIDSLLFIFLFFERIAFWLYGNVNDSNGKLVTLIISIIGGWCVIKGLYINEKRVNEQTRQNDISTQNNNDKRFGEAISYLNNDNKGIAIGGIYSLYQLAKEDIRYAPIITNIFINYINTNPETDESSIMIDLLFSKNNNPFVFNNDIVFNKLRLKNKTLYCKKCKLIFNKCSFTCVNFAGEKSIKFDCCDLNHSIIFGYKIIKIEEGNARYIDAFGNISHENVIYLRPENISHSHFYLTDVIALHIEPKYLENVTIEAFYIYELYINDNFTIADGTRLFINSPQIKNLKNKHISGAKDGIISIFNKDNSVEIKNKYDYYQTIIEKF